MINAPPDLAVHAADLAIVRDVRGLYIGLLSDDERAAFDRLYSAGLAYRDHAEGCPFFGASKVAVQGDLWKERRAS